MKIRNGFVSNSSSSSFIVVGFYVPKTMKKKEIVSKLFANDPDYPKVRIPDKIRGCKHTVQEAKYCPECGNPMWIEKRYNYEDDLRDYMYEVFSSKGLHFDEYSNYLGAEVLFYGYGDGLSSTSMDKIDKAEETIKEMQEKLDLLDAPISLAMIVEGQ